MKVTIWTNPWHIDETKCIFNGNLKVIPQIGDKIIIKIGQPLEIIKSRSFNLEKNSVELIIFGSGEGLETVKV